MSLEEFLNLFGSQVIHSVNPDNTVNTIRNGIVETRKPPVEVFNQSFGSSKVPFTVSVAKPQLNKPTAAATTMYIASTSGITIDNVIINGIDSPLTAKVGDFVEIFGEGFSEVTKLWFPLGNLDNYVFFPDVSYETKTVQEGSETVLLANIFDAIFSLTDDKIEIVLPEIGTVDTPCGSQIGRIYAETDEEEANSDEIVKLWIADIDPIVLEFKLKSFVAELERQVFAQYVDLFAEVDEGIIPAQLPDPPNLFLHHLIVISPDVPNENIKDVAVRFLWGIKPAEPIPPGAEDYFDVTVSVYKIIVEKFSSFDVTVYNQYEGEPSVPRNIDLRNPVPEAEVSYIEILDGSQSETVFTYQMPLKDLEYNFYYYTSSLLGIINGQLVYNGFGLNDAVTGQLAGPSDEVVDNFEAKLKTSFNTVAEGANNMQYYQGSAGSSFSSSPIDMFYDTGNTNPILVENAAVAESCNPAQDPIEMQPDLVPIQIPEGGSVFVRARAYNTGFIMRTFVGATQTSSPGWSSLGLSPNDYLHISNPTLRNQAALRAQADNAEQVSFIGPTFKDYHDNFVTTVTVVTSEIPLSTGSNTLTIDFGWVKRTEPAYPGDTPSQEGIPITVVFDQIEVFVVVDGESTTLFSQPSVQVNTSMKEFTGTITITLIV